MIKKNGEGRVNEWINRAKFIENCSSEHRENFGSVCWSCYSIRKLEAEAVLLEQAVLLCEFQFRASLPSIYNYTEYSINV